MKAEDRKKILAGGKPPARAKSRGKVGAADNAPAMTLQDHIISWTKTIITSLLIVMVVNGLLIASFVVPTGSMENEVMAGDFLFVNKFIYGGSSPQTIPFVDIPLPYFRLPGLRDPEKGDVIVFIFPGMRDQVQADEFQYYLKRCVATQGDTLQVIDKKVFVNGVEQPVPRNAVFEPGINHETARIFPLTRGFSRDNWGPMRIPKEGDIIPLNDSTQLMYDTFIRREGHEFDRQGEIFLIDGKPATEYKVERDYVFGMGDNRDQSLDSRYWGFVPKENVVGTPMMVYWSWPPEGSVSNKLGHIRWGRIFNIVK
jgi:signal peptidase I